MKTIVISGSHSNIGKTGLCEKILHSLKNWSALKITVAKPGSRCPRDTDCTVCPELKGDFEIVADKKIIDKKDTDTGRMKDAGAKKVVWLKANLKGLRPGLRKALNHLKDSKGVVIEGTSVLRYIDPDLAIYLKGNRVQPRAIAKLAQKKADIVIEVEGRE